MAQRLRMALLAAALVALPAVASAQVADAVPYDGLQFEDIRHRRWYARFWTGRCTDLSLFVCFSGRPYWHETMRTLVAEAPPEQRPMIAARLFALGRRIGHEWAKENDVRKISTSDIRRWYREFEQTRDTAAAIARIESEADRLLAGK